MLVLITYDVSVLTTEGRRRLRNIAKTCLDFGMRVQNSVFECEIEPADWVALKGKLLDFYDESQDSLRFYQLGSRGRQKVEHFGTKKVPDVLRDPLIL
jgi:CRISPR-associated protein Cas2